MNNLLRAIQNRLNSPAWRRFAAIAQPYWYPTQQRGGWVFLGLLMLMLVFVAAILFALIALASWVGQSFFSEFFNGIAPGLSQWVSGVMNSWVGYTLGLGLIFTPICFFWVRRPLQSRWQQWALLAVLLLLTLSVTGINVITSYVGNFFTTALQKKDAVNFWKFTYVYATEFIIAIPIVSYYSYVQDKLGLYWRQWLTGSFLERYFGNRSFYEINSDPDIDNPDQRLSEDIRSFTRSTLIFLLIILGSLFDLLSFTGILWSISVPLTAILLLYALTATLGVSVLFGRRLVGLNFNQLRREADFRYSLVHVRDNAESIAFYRGEEQESSQIRRRFLAALNNFNLLIGWQRNLSFFTSGYRYFVIILPSIILAPAYFAGNIELGVLTQANFAFGQIFGAISLIVNQFESLTTYVASVNRLGDFSEVLKPDAEARKRGGSLIEVETAARIALSQVTLQTPNYQSTLVRDLSLTVQPGEGLLVMGQSGCGKSSLLRAIAGLWRSGSGRIVRPENDEMMFLPQRPYMILGTLRDQLLYPHLNSDTPEANLRAMLEKVNLANLPERVGGFDVELDWGDLLSLGEQQRLAFARLLLSQPGYAILDEATSALDVRNEQALYEELQRTCTVYISVGHRTSLLKYHRQVLEMDGESGWRLVSAQDYTPSAGVPL